MEAAVNAVANTTISVYRGSTEDGYGDPEESETPTRTGIAASLIEGRPRQVDSGTSTTPRFIRVATLRVGYGTDIQADDRIKDETTGTFWRIDSLGNVGNPAYAPDLRVDLSTQ